MIGISPGIEQFTKMYHKEKIQLIWQEMPADLETPITASFKLQEQGKPFFLLESVENGERRGRYSIIGLEPDVIWRCNDNYAEININGQGFKRQDKEVLESFREVYDNLQFDVPKELPPMASGLIGYMSYDAIRYTEKTVPDNNPDPIDIPTGVFMRPTIMVIFDSVKSSLFIITVVNYSDNQESEQVYSQALMRIEEITKKLSGSVIGHQVDNQAEELDLSFQSNLSREEYHEMVNKAKEYIYAGDIFQVVPSQRFSTEYKMPPFALYRSLRHLNPSPFLFYLDFADFQLIGSSPEILVRLQDEKVTIRPLAGTRKRGATPEEDKALEKDLLSDEKEISEHLMLIDLSRNDVGRVTQPGTVKVTEEMVIERYSHVMHISSNVEGVLDAQKYDALDALFSGMPVGTVSGAPKVRAMQIIDELEKEKRSFYAGCVGYFSANGTMETCITLRTALTKENRLYLQAGGGVVADSDPEAEYQESCNKAKALMQAARMSKKFA